MLVLLTVAAMVLAAGCGRIMEPTPTPTPITPATVASNFWEAFARNDQNTMLDCLDPELRTDLDPYGEIGLPLAAWLRTVLEMMRQYTDQRFVELEHMACTEADNDGTVAHVRCEVRVKVIGIAEWKVNFVQAFPVTHTLLKIGGRWYLSRSR